jgi:acetolactate synthase-1/2/3 large subunit
MKARTVIAKILKAEGVKYVFTFPTNPLLEGAAEEGIRIITGRTERHAIHMADGYSRVTNGNPIGVCMVQGGPGAQHAFPGIAQAWQDSTPVLLLPAGPPRARIGLTTEFDPVPNFNRITKWSGAIGTVGTIQDRFAHAFTQLKFGRRRPVMLATPIDIMGEEIADSDFSYVSIRQAKTAADPNDVTQAVRMLLAAKRPIIHVGQGVLAAEATAELVAFADLVQIPVMTTLLGKSAFPENHPLSLGAGANSVTGMIERFLGDADLIFSIGSSLTRSLAACELPPGKTIVQVTLDEREMNGEYRIQHAVIGDAKLVLPQLIAETRVQLGQARRVGDGIAAEIRGIKQAWLQSWMPKLTSDQVPINPYRVIWDLAQTVDRAKTIITHDAGMPRDQMFPFYESLEPRGYIGWGNSHQLGSSLGLIMGAKLAAPDKLCINLIGDAGFATVSTDMETAVRERIPILTVVLKNSIMALYGKYIPVAAERYGVTKVTGDNVKLAESLGYYAERVDQPSEIIPALKRCIARIEGGQPALLEVVTMEETVTSKWGATNLPK